METVLITGANKGIGFEVARQLMRKGFHVLLGSRDRDRGESAAKTLRSEGSGEVEAILIDIVEEATIQAAAATVKERFGKLDVLINNAGVYLEQAEPSLSDARLLRQTFETNFFAAVAVTQAFLPLLRAAEHPRIVNVSSGLGSLALHSDPSHFYFSLNALSYCSSKAALNAFTVLLANELREPGIKVNAADPGYTATDMNGHSGPQTVEEGSEAIVQLATLGADGPTGTYLSREGIVPW